MKTRVSYFEHLPLQRSLHGPAVSVCVCVCVCVCVHVYVVYEDTNLYNNMGMT